ncbi:hypothetical protein [Dyella subtropica]|uniref:hypothetical protein n=1 Tax=Dyella subtropica TaxID=2992127 RepID=UPI00224D0254|nr:hypothetical protein [Dyella subtropica]
MQKSGLKESSVTLKALTFGRWIAFLPAAWLAGYAHNWILRAFGVSMSSHVVAASDSDLFAFGVAGFLTPICVIAVGAFICPTKRKALPVLALCAVFVVAGARSLSRSIASGQLWHPFGLNAFFIVSVPALIAITYLVVFWRSSRSQRA